ncbi:MAG TPA: DUF1003 domain-containing protein [Pyrinomonadaceae bacterium]|jgi:uncharacterized membrane protein
MSSATLSQKEIIRRNVAAITEEQQKAHQERSVLNRISDGITVFSGSMVFVFIHAVWFGLWILFNIGVVNIPHVSEFDPFPFGLLTMVVSLEAIFLSTFVLISQNRMSKLNEQRAELDLHVNLLAEQKATKALEMLDQITQQLNTVSRFNFAHDPEIEALKKSPQPQEVLDVMRETIKEEVADVKQKVAEKVEEAVEEITGEMEAVHEEVKDTTGETKALRENVKRMDDKVKVVAGDVHDIKEKIEEQTGEHEEMFAK